MPKMPNSREDHGDGMFVASRDRFLIAYGTARLGDGLDSDRCGQVDIVAKWEERVGGHDRALAARAGLACRHVYRIDAAHLTGADAYHHLILGKHDGIAFHVLAYGPGEL